MLDGSHKKIMAYLGKTVADTEKPDCDSGMMQSAEEHQEFTKKEAAVMPVGNGVGTGICPRGAARSQRQGSRQLVNQGGD
jgi:hypothetical protein